MVELKELMEGTSLGGEYTVEEWIGYDGTGTFLTARRTDGERVLIKAVSTQEAHAESQFDAWRRLRDLRHTNLLDLHDVGRGEVEGHYFIYGVFQNPDDILMSLLEKGPLSEAETRSVLQATVEALRYLHGRGLVHGAVTPDHVVGVGEIVKLATDVTQESDSPEARMEDVRQLGEMVRTLRAPEALGEPLATIARQATGSVRWTMAEIGEVLNAPPTPPAPPAPHVPSTEAAAPSRPFPKWIVAGVAAVMFGLVGFSLLRRSDEAQPLPPAPTPVAARVGPSNPTPTPAVSAPPAPTPTKAVVPPQSRSSASAMWRVIAFTYRSHDLAAKKAKQINDRWPGLHAVVFAPKTLRGYYLVALGDRMEREEATSLLNKARRLGLPRDAYVQNYSE